MSNTLSSGSNQIGTITGTTHQTLTGSNGIASSGTLTIGNGTWQVGMAGGGGGSSGQILTSNTSNTLGYMNTDVSVPYVKEIDKEVYLTSKIKNLNEELVKLNSALESFKSLKYNLGEVIFHKDFGKGIIVTKLSEYAEDFSAYRSTITGYKCVFVKIKDGYSVFSPEDVLEKDITLYDRKLEALYG